jgi:glycosyltransferase involved in cell wall biosynthesis
MSEQRRVLVLNHFAVPRDQAGGTRHVELFSRLPDWQYTIIASRLNLSTGRRQATEEGFTFVPVIPYRSNGISRVVNWISYAVMATIAGFQAPRPDVVYASSPHLLAALAGWVIARTRRARFILEVRDLWPRVLVDMGRLSESSALYRALHALELFLYKRADRVVVMAPGCRTALQSLGVPESKISYIPNGADPEDFVASIDTSTLRARYGFTRLTGIYTGAHGPANGLDLLLDAAECVADLPVDIILVGDGLNKAELIRDASRRQLTNVRFMDPVPKTEIPDLLAAADFGLHVLADVELFRSSVSPNKIFDYMAAGLYVLTNCTGIVGDLVTKSGAGMVVGPLQLELGLKAVCMTAPAARAECGDRGREWIEREQSRTAMASRLEALLRAVAA